MLFRANMVTVCVAFMVSAVGLQAGVLPPSQDVSTVVTGHGGGCRKSSPAGQCCHMDRKAGEVHCH